MINNSVCLVLWDSRDDESDRLACELYQYLQIIILSDKFYLRYKYIIKTPWSIGFNDKKKNQQNLLTCTTAASEKISWEIFTKCPERTKIVQMLTRKMQILACNADSEQPSITAQLNNNKIIIKKDSCWIWTAWSWNGKYFSPMEGRGNIPGIWEK